ncbi:MAG TPA: carbohydrate ABC transporter permease [Plantibacter sp.]|uniref:carbohydrate ABC transporter permease n=1 Tax=unclassified Plantibacter TaxID=2624265 RepID=UPI002C5F8A2B|nr:carbohydrate ABC transporter permease [Plantibacter sp.]
MMRTEYPEPDTETVDTVRVVLPNSAAATRDSVASRRRSRINTWVLYAILVIVSIPFIYPTVWMIFSAFKPTSEIFSQPPTLLPTSWTLDGFAKIFTTQPFLQQYGNSLYIAVIVTAGSLVVSGLAGYAFARMRFPFRNALFVILLASMMVPSEVTIIPIFTAVNAMGLTDTHWPLILMPLLGPSSVVSVFIFRQYFLSLPGELEEAARLDGLGRVGIFTRIAFPLARPAIAAVTILTFLRSFNMYFEPLIFLTTPAKFTVALGITRYQDAYGEPLWTTQLGAASLTVIPILIVFLLAQKQFIEGIAGTGLKG